MNSFRTIRGLLALGGNQTTPNNDNNAVVGQPQAGVGGREGEGVGRQLDGALLPRLEAHRRPRRAREKELETQFQQKEKDWVAHLREGGAVRLAQEIDCDGCERKRLAQEVREAVAAAGARELRRDVGRNSRHFVHQDLLLHLGIHVAGDEEEIGKAVIIEIGS